MIMMGCGVNHNGSCCVGLEFGNWEEVGFAPCWLVLVGGGIIYTFCFLCVILKKLGMNTGFGGKMDRMV